MNQSLTPSLIKDINPGSGSSNLRDLTNFNGELSFIIGNIWKSDGTTDGTVQNSSTNVLFDGFPAGVISELLTNVGDQLFFLAGVGANQFSSQFIARTDGTTDGTFRIFTISEGSVSPGTPSGITSSLGDSENLNEKFAFVIQNIDFADYQNPDFFDSLLISDGTKDGTSVIKAFTPEDSINRIMELTDVNGTLFFATSGNSGSAANQLWKTDGTEAGTVIVKDIKPGVEYSNLKDLTDISGTLFFTADDGTNGRELWKSDGTETGTVLIEDINPGEASSNPDKLTDVNGTAYFIANNGTNGNELWKSDGTETGTVLVKDIITGSEGSNADNLTNVNGTLFFTVDDGANGAELWKSDGTESGTSLVEDINPGTNSSNPDNLTNFDGTLYFTADDGANGTELWKSDGTAEGTVLADDINPGSTSSNPQDLTVVDDELYFSADDGVNGRELWGLTKTEADKDLILGGNSTENDILVGGDRDNIIDGLKGDDTLTGGGGKDKFVLSTEFGNDVITDFTLGEDEIINATNNIVLIVASVGDAIKVAFSNTGDVLQVNLNGNDRVELENYLLDISSNQALPY